MSIDDERAARGRLNAALGEYPAGPVPLGAVIRRGERLKTRRRAGAAATAALAIAAAIIAPVAARQFTYQPGPSTAARYHVTVNAPGPGSPRGLIADGTVNGRPWQVIGRQHATVPHLCFLPTLGASGTCDSGDPLTRASGAPATDMFGMGRVSIGIARADVTSLRMRLTNGQVLTLRPVAVFGARYARYYAFALPASSAVTSITAYSARGEVAYTIPFTAAGPVDTVVWHTPGTGGAPRATYRIGAGGDGGERWTEYAYLGPWGSCFTSPGSGDVQCYPEGLTGLLGHRTVTMVGSTDTKKATQVALIVAAPSVTSLRVTEGGRTVRPPVVRAGGARLSAFALAGGTARWTAYTASGAVAGSGSIPG